MRILVELSQAQLRVEKDDGSQLVFPVGVGRPNSPTPTGVFPIVGKEPGSRKSPGGKTIYISMPGKLCGIFGTAQARAVGRPVTGGCISMLNRDIEILYDLVDVGMEVEIVP